MSLVPYNKEALEAELPRLIQQAEMFESKAAEIRAQIAQHKLWIKQHEDENSQKLKGRPDGILGSWNGKRQA